MSTTAFPRLALACFAVALSALSCTSDGWRRCIHRHLRSESDPTHWAGSLHILCCGPEAIRSSREPSIRRRGSLKSQARSRTSVRAAQASTGHPRIADRLAGYAEAYGLPDKVVISGGANDAERGMPWVAVKAGIDGTHDWLTSRGVDVQWVTPPLHHGIPIGTAGSKLVHDHLVGHLRGVGLRILAGQAAPGPLPRRPSPPVGLG